MPLNKMPVDGEATPDGSAAAPALLALSLDIAEDLALDGEVATLPAAVQALLAEDDGEADLVQLLAELFPQLIPQLEAQGFVIGDASDEPGEHLLRDDEGDIIGVMIGDQLYPVQLQVENGEAAPLQAAQVGSSAAPVMLSGKTPAQANVASTVPQESNRPVRDASAAAPAPLLAAAPVTGEAMSQVVLPVSETSSLEGQQGLASWQTNTSGSIDISRLTSSTSAEPPAPQASNEAERAVEHQIKRALIQQMANGDRSMTLRLTPPHLGTVRIEIVEQRGMLTVRFSAEDDRVRQALERQLPQLRQDLRASDAPVSSVRMDDHQSGWQHDQQQRQQHAQERNGSHSGGRFRLDDEEVDSDGNSADTASTAPSASLGGSVSESAVDARA